jgi:D-glycero-D-manno-heptose 1,7-bisphosphate phosphatase
MPGIVFLDRDGTLIRDTGYLSDPALVEPIAGAPEGLRNLASHGFLLAVVSNQAGLARGRFDEAQQAAVHERFVELFESLGVRFDAVEYCPHHPEGTVARYRLDCACRKPGTGMPDRVLARLSVPATWSRWMVGDKLIDVRMGRRIGARTVLVATGYGPSELERCDGEECRPDAYLPDMKEAANWIVSTSSKA